MPQPKRFIPPTSALRALESFERTRSVTETGVELGVSQSAVSRQLKVLEEFLGAPLFIRDKKRISLTSAARDYCDEIRVALDQIGNASLRLKANPSGGHINIATLPSFGLQWLSPRLPDFVRKHPEVKINLSSRTKAFDFFSTGHHGAFQFGQKDWPEVNYLHLMKEYVLPVAAPMYRERSQSDDIYGVLELPLLHLETRPDAWEAWADAHDHCAIAPEGMLFDQFTSMIQAALHGLGVALIPTYLITDELNKGLLVPLLDGPPVSIGDYFFVWPKARQHSQQLMLFQAWLERQTTRKEEFKG